jgi:RND family efflux transporter MFP subunit
MKRNTWLYIATIAIVAASGGSYFYCKGGREDVKWRIAQLDKGEIRQRVSATGTLSALLEVDVGTQVSGMVTSLNADYNSIVVKDQIIATIDETIHSQQVRTEEINVERSKTNLDDTERQFKRYQVLAEQKLVSASDLETREVAYRTSKATYENALISLEKAKSNLAYCTIKAPVNGVVVSRKADVGQTVTASMSTPSLFIIAQDLRKMKLEITIDEADIAQLNVGQRANFTVDSIPDAQFSGTVSQVRLEPITNQNVVSYKVVVEVQNQTKQEIEEQKARRQAMGAGGMMPGRMGPGGEGGPGGTGTPSAGPGAAAPSAVPGGVVAAPGTAPAIASNNPNPQNTQAKAGAPAQPVAASDNSPQRQAMPGGQPGREGRPMGAFASGDGPPDFDAMWERMKDRIQERQPGITKEAWIQQAKERQGQMAQGGGSPADGRPGQTGSPRQTDTPRQRGAASTPQQIAAAASASGLLKAGGHFYQGEYVLRPGMTANVTIITNQKSGILRVPNTALRFDPSAYIKEDPKPAAQAAGQQRPPGAGGGTFQAGAQQPDRRSRLMDRGIVARREDRVWTLDEKRKPKAVVVQAGLTDGQFTEITGEEATEGMEILIGVDDPKRSSPGAAGSPFQMGNRPMGGGGGGGRR